MIKDEDIEMQYVVVCTNDNEPVIVVMLNSDGDVQSIIYKHHNQKGQFGFLSGLIPKLIGKKTRLVYPVEVGNIPSRGIAKKGIEKDALLDELLPKFFTKAMDAFYMAKAIDEETFIDGPIVVDLLQWLDISGRIPINFKSLIKFVFSKEVLVESFLFLVSCPADNPSDPPLYVAVTYNVLCGYIEKYVSIVDLFHHHNGLPPKCAFAGTLHNVLDDEDFHRRMDKLIYALEHGDPDKLQILNHLADL